MNLPEFGVKRPVTNIMIFSAIIILALYSLTRLGIDSMPEIEPPSISVISTYEGASPEDVEIKVSEPLENQLATTPGIEKITSRSLEGLSVVTLKFVWGTNLDEASNDIRDRIERAKRFLPDIPDEMDTPFIFKFNTAMFPILMVGITAEQSYPELFDMIDKRVGDPLRQIPGVGTVQLNGGLERQINIWIDRHKLEGYGFSILDVQDVLAKENVTQPAGSIKSGFTDYLLRVPGEFATPDEINSVILGKRNGNLVYLKDVARVEDSFKEVTNIVRINRHQGLLMMIQKQTGTNTVEVANRVKKKMDELQKTLPKDVKMYPVMDSSHDIINSLNSLKSTVWVGGILVILVVWFFLRQFLPSLVIALTIPFSLLIAFIYLFLSGKTINTISLSSLTIAIGMVVDNAIVVVDNIHRHLERGQRLQEASIFGTSEMFLAIAASTLTTVVVFLPLIFITGVVGIMFGELAIIVIVTLLASLFTAVTFTPMLASKWMGVNNGQAKAKFKWFSKFYQISEHWFKSWEEFYRKCLAWCLGHKKIVIFGFLGAFIFSLFLTRFVGNEFIPEQDSGDLRTTVNLPIGTRLEETDKVATKIEDIFKEEAPEEKFMYVRSGLTTGVGAVFGGQSGTHITSGGAKLVPKTERKRSVKEIAQVIRNRIRQIPGVLKTDITTGSPIGRIITGTAGKQVQVEIIGHSFEDTNTVAQKIKEIMEKIPGAIDISISRELNRPELRIEVYREKAAALGLNMRTIADSIKTFVEGATATKYREKGETYDIYVRLEEQFRAKPEDVENLSIVSPFTGKQIKLSTVARVYETAGPIEIERKNRERVLRVECNTYKRSMGKVIEDIKKSLKKITIPSDIVINFGGEAEEQGKAFKDLILLLLLGIALVYMVMAAQFESLLDPFIIMFAIPFTFTGVILGFILTGTTLSVITFLGMVMLMGIVVNNAIVLVSYINILRARGLSMLDAVTIGGKERLRPVLMTTITTVAGLLPLALSTGEGSEVWQPLGITMLGGLSLSTLVTMFFVPTLYAVFEAKIRKERLPAGRQGGKKK
ncbi:multidrug efflux pump subunit AcrB [Candidatus Velamenicoccus archaeovorus]|uniref:Multidrug efflux pump subunit AcrB n=1 Tax=Velamenicoccus archaeovorus TaxID=1930593 RepID=A0A410P5U7_VELA1|nr:efflux RND transporter permease subunit [Candidatus Velamenicoccus archaeovorus]QAT17565.1 multidrug efflux pump subunit AcrB [Candidatus Velamenicoccus archaeovorus]